MIGHRRPCGGRLQSLVHGIHGIGPEYKIQSLFILWGKRVGDFGCVTT